MNEWYDLPWQWSYNFVYSLKYAWSVCVSSLLGDGTMFIQYLGTFLRCITRGRVGMTIIIGFDAILCILCELLVVQALGISVLLFCRSATKRKMERSSSCSLVHSPHTPINWKLTHCVAPPGISLLAWFVFSWRPPIVLNCIRAFPAQVKRPAILVSPHPVQLTFSNFPLCPTCCRPFRSPAACRSI